MIVLTRVRIASLVRILVLSVLMLTTSVGLYCHQKGSNTQKISRDVYRLKADILYANLAIRNAAIATTKQDIETELSKTMVTRADADDVYKNLEQANLNNCEKKLVLAMQTDRPKYREAQNKIVKYIRANDDLMFWYNLPTYQVYMDVYLQRTDNLISSINSRAEIEHERLKSLMLFTLVFGMGMVSYALWRVFR